MKDKISLFIKSIQDCVIIINNRGIIIDSNPAIQKVLGYTPEELTGNNVSMLMGIPHQAKHDQYIHNHQTTGISKIIGVGRARHCRHGGNPRRHRNAILEVQLAVKQETAKQAG